MNFSIAQACTKRIKLKEEIVELMKQVKPLRIELSELEDEILKHAKDEDPELLKQNHNLEVINKLSKHAVDDDLIKESIKESFDNNERSPNVIIDILHEKQITKGVKNDRLVFKEPLKPKVYKQKVDKESKGVMRGAKLIKKIFK